MVFVNIELEGVAEQTINKLIEQGYAKTKTEAIRLSILQAAEKYNLINQEQELITRKIERIQKTRGLKFLTEKQVLEKYPELKE